MLGASAIEQLKNKKEVFKKIGIASTFGAGLLKELDILNQASSDAYKVRETAESSINSINRTFTEAQQIDMATAMRAGLDLKSGSIAALSAQRSALVRAEQARIKEAERYALSSISDKETAESIGNIFGIGLGVLSWIFL